MLSTGDLEGLAFALLHELAHIAKRHTLQNLSRSHRFGDLRRQYFLFANQYIGFDALMQEYYTNTRGTLDQELECDMFALRVMRECGMRFGDSEKYREILKILEGEATVKDALRKSVNDTLAGRVKQAYIDEAKKWQSTCQLQDNLKEKLRLRVQQLRQKYVQQELDAKAERKRLRDQRDYEIFDQMPYKFNTKIFTMREKHPISKARFDSASAFIQASSRVDDQ